MKVILVEDPDQTHYGAWVESEADKRHLWATREASHVYEPKAVFNTCYVLGLPLQVASKSLWDKLLLLAVCERAEVWERQSA